MASLEPPFAPEHALYVDPFAIPSMTSNEPGERSSVSEASSTFASALTDIAPPPIKDTDDDPPFKLHWPSLFGPVEDTKRLFRGDVTSVIEYIASDLDLKRLNRLHWALKFCSSARKPRSLHYKLSVGINIVPVEQCDLHLILGDSNLYVKPLPAYLLCYSVWKDYICKHGDTYGLALGICNSYIWLVRYPSDFRIAIELGLLPGNLSWATWSNFTHAFLDGILAGSPRKSNKRYEYGELRLNRLDWLYSIFTEFSGGNDPWFFLTIFAPPGSWNAMRLLKVSARYLSITVGILGLGWSAPYWDRGRPTYTAFLKNNMSILISTAGFIALVLTAMQVGLATKELQDNVAFQRASYGFTVFSIFFSIVTPLAIFYIIFTAVMLSQFRSLSQLLQIPKVPGV